VGEVINAVSQQIQVARHLWRSKNIYRRVISFVVQTSRSPFVNNRKR
jgi:hypothetical protein